MKPRVEVPARPAATAPRNGIRLDEIDLTLVRELQSDARQSNVALARKVKLTEGAVRRRIDNLLTRGALRIVAVADPETLGLHTHAVIGLRVDIDRIEPLSDELAGMRELSYVYQTAGQFDIIVVGFFASTEQLRVFLTKRLGQLHGVKGTDTYVVLRTMKRSLRWGEVVTEEAQAARAAFAEPERIARPGPRRTAVRSSE
jgi:Lrp/AsnC family transcriptional regulator for asnA, asnC and gidA